MEPLDMKTIVTVVMNNKNKDKKKKNAYHSSWKKSEKEKPEKKGWPFGN